jgi:hypothetical protein
MPQPLTPNRSPGLTASRPDLASLIAAAFLVIVATVAVPQAFAQNVSDPGTPAPHTSILLPAVNRPPDANARMEMRDQQTRKKNFDAANAERKRQITEDSALLLKLANDLKGELEKTPEDALSVSELRKIEDIERLAHNVQQKMKLTIGAN